MPTFPKHKISDKFKLAEQEFNKRWEIFAHDKKFCKYTRHFDEQNILQEFKELHQQRERLYYEEPLAKSLKSNPGYERSQILLEQGLYKAPHLIAFEYNVSHQSYNSSNITLNSYKFLALEGPQQVAHVNNFLTVLIDYNVQKLVRLTADFENGIFKSQNYWQNNIITDTQDHQYITIKVKAEKRDLSYKLPYYTIDNWEDNKGIDPDVLLNMLYAVRENFSTDDLIAVHCCAGVGRTGTFIAGFTLLEDIDKQLQNGVDKDNLNLSIQELVYKLSIQRAYLVGQPEQYLTLHKMVNLYLDQI